MDLKEVFESIDSLIGRRGLGYLLSVSVISIGFLEIFVAYPTMYVELDTLKLVFLACALVVVPVFLAIVAYVYGLRVSMDGPHTQLAFTSCAGNFVVFGVIAMLTTRLSGGGFWPYVLACLVNAGVAWYSGRHAHAA